MLTFVERGLLRNSCCFIKQFSIALKSTCAPQYHNDNSNDDFIDEDNDFNDIRRDTSKCLKIALIGLPSVGKSTLINRLIDRPICATASKYHVTRAKSNAVYTENDTQLIFIDTPGIVSAHEFKKFKLEDSFKKDSNTAMQSADIIGVVQDTSNIYTRGVIHNKILELLKMNRVGVPSILIMNKVDKMKQKRELLTLVKFLTSEKGWPNFSDVFMVSALTSDGVIDLRNYFLDSAKSRDWEYAADILSDQPIEKMIELIIRAKLLDYLPNEVPYQLKIEMEYLETSDDGTINCVVVIITQAQRILKIVLGKHGSRIKIIATEAEQQLSKALRVNFKLKICVNFTEK